MNADEVCRLYEDLMYSGETSIQLENLPLHGSVFEDQDLKCSVWLNCDLSGVTFINCDLRGSDFTRSRLERARFVHCDLRVSEFPDDPTMEMVSSAMGAMSLSSSTAYV